MASVQMRAVAYNRDGVWIVQGIEHDIRARASHRDDAQRAITDAVRERIALDIHLGRKPLEGLKRAPQEFADMFDRAKVRSSDKNDGEVEVRLA